MTSNLKGYDANKFDPMGEFGPIPAGRYTATITSSEFKANKKGTGRYLEFVFSILEGDFKGRNLWARLNLENPNQDTVTIANSELSSICRAVDKMIPSDSSTLHDIPIEIKVVQRKRADNGELTNEVKGYYSVAKQGSKKKTETSVHSPAETMDEKEVVTDLGPDITEEEYSAKKEEEAVWGD